MCAPDRRRASASCTRAVGPVIRDRALESVRERHARPPAEFPLQPIDVRDEIAGFDLLGERRPVDELDASAAGHRSDGARHVEERRPDAAADVEDGTLVRRRFADTEDGFDRIIYIYVVAALPPVAVNPQDFTR